MFIQEPYIKYLIKCYILCHPAYKSGYHFGVNILAGRGASNEAQPFKVL